MQFRFAVLLFACILFIKEAAYRRLDGSAHFLSMTSFSTISVLSLISVKNFADPLQIIVQKTNSHTQRNAFNPINLI